MEQPLGFNFRELSHEKLIKYAEFLLRQYRLVDAHWFLKVEDNFGLDLASKFNEEIWAKLGEVSAKDIIRYIGVEKGDLKSVLEALKYFPWTIIASWKITEFSDKRAVILAERCPPQESRLKSGRKIFACKAMQQSFFENFVKIFNSSIKVRCHNAPPDPKPQGYWCKWELILE
ncbi:MAG: DUF6125 family protein [Nitrososphaerales archaeon]